METIALHVLRTYKAFIPSLRISLITIIISQNPTRKAKEIISEFHGCPRFGQDPLSAHLSCRTLPSLLLSVRSVYACPIWFRRNCSCCATSTERSEEHTSELQSQSN